MFNLFMIKEQEAKDLETYKGVDFPEVGKLYCIMDLSVT